jgi:hypothetical protein
MGIGMKAGDVRKIPRQGFVGELVYNSGHNKIGGGFNSVPQRKQVATIVVDTATNSAVYTFSVGGQTLTFTAPASGTTTASVAAQIVAAINANGVARGLGVPVSDGAATVTITGLWPGIVFDVSDADAKLTSTVTVAALSADPIPFGRALIQTGYSQRAGKLVGLPEAARFTAQVITLAIAYEANAKITVEIFEKRGNDKISLFKGSETSATNQATTLTALAGVLNGGLAPNTVLVASTGTALTFTAEVPGTEIEVEYEVGDEGAAIPAITKTYSIGPDPSTSLHRGWGGVSMASNVDEAPTRGSGPGQYAANAGVRLLELGAIWVESAEVVARSGTVFVETLAGPTCGRFYTTGGTATRIGLDRARARWERDGRDASDSLAALRLLTF